MKAIRLLVIVLLGGCVGLPEGVEPVAGFDAERYLGTWYEVARLDHSFERGLSRVSATYSRRDDGGIRVLNRGYDAQKKRWQEAEGKAYFVEGKERGYLKVSFFGPFYGAYVVAELDHEHYQYSLVSGPDRSYLWILSRTPRMEPAIQQRLIEKAAALGFDTGRLIFVQHE